jgi:DNA-binding NtrC family response regulator
MALVPAAVNLFNITADLWRLGEPPEPSRAKFTSMASPDRILIVDDDADTRLLLEGVLQQAGFDTACAENGTRALQLLDQQKFDLVLTDKNMSGFDGHTLVNEIWTRHPNVGTAMITGYRSDESEDRAREQRILAYFEKPIYDLRQVADTLKVVLEEHRQKLAAS